jgi:flagellar basal-body rod protein FlgF
MDALIFTAMSGANRALKAQQIHANNLANSETTGFRADFGVARSQAVPGSGFDARHMTLLEPAAVNSRAGVIHATGRELDVAIEGEGFLAVLDQGQEVYTRAGNLNIGPDGALSVLGRPVLGDGGAITLPPFSQLAIASDGTLSVQAQGESVMQPVARLKLVRPAAEELGKNASGFIISRAGGTLPADDSVRVKGGHLERSNVSAVEEMIATMALGRDFELQMKMFNTASEMADAGNRLVRG